MALAMLSVSIAKAENVTENLNSSENLSTNAIDNIDMSAIVEEAVKEASEVKSLYEEADPFADIAVLEAPAAETVKPIGTYKNWIGEECLLFDESSKNYYNWKRDVTYAGVPLFLASFIVKGQKKAFRSARFAMDENWKSKIDDYSQFSPYLAVVGMKALGYQGRSSWDRLMTSALLSNGVMALIVNATKYSVKEMRPDNSQANSFPSGHTATAFTAATVLHKEYGLTRSPWFSVGGYTVAMGTGFMRVLNNRHWISDVIAGAGIGILSTEVGYFLADQIYKNKGITRLELDQYTNPNHPSFFSIEMGVAMHKQSMDAHWEDDTHTNFDLGTSSVVGVEGAYFFNKYFGIGGMARVTTTPIKGLGLTDDDMTFLYSINETTEKIGMPGIYNVKTSTSNLIDGSFDVGIYGNIPLDDHFSIGAKALIGVRVNGGFEYKGTMGHRMHAVDAMGNPLYTYSHDMDKGDIKTPLYVFENADGSTFISNDVLLPGVSTSNNYYLDPQCYKSKEYTMSKLTGKSNFNYVFGLSFNYKYKQNFAWRVFIDYDSAKNHYNYKFNTIDEDTYNNIRTIYTSDDQQGIIDEMHKLSFEDSFKSRLNLFTIGAGFTVNF